MLEEIAGLPERNNTAPMQMGCLSGQPCLATAMGDKAEREAL